MKRRSLGRTSLGALALVGALRCGDGRLDLFITVPPAGGAAPGNDVGGASGSAAGPELGGASGSAAEPELGGASGSVAEPGLGGELNTSGGLAGSLGGEPGQGGHGGAGPVGFVIDDFEDGDTQALGTDGWWYTVNDLSGTQSFGLEPVTDRPGSSHAMRTRGEGFTSWGAAIGVDLNVSAAYFDAGAYDALRFWIRSAADVDPAVHVALQDEDGVHFGFDIETTTSWQEFTVSFAEFVGPEAQPTMTGRELRDVQFFALADQPFDFMLDDLELVAAE